MNFEEQTDCLSEKQENCCENCAKLKGFFYFHKLFKIIGKISYYYKLCFITYKNIFYFVLCIMFATVPYAHHGGRIRMYFFSAVSTVQHVLVSIK